MKIQINFVSSFFLSQLVLCAFLWRHIADNLAHHGKRAIRPRDVPLALPATLVQVAALIPTFRATLPFKIASALRAFATWIGFRTVIPERHLFWNVSHWIAHGNEKSFERISAACQLTSPQANVSKNLHAARVPLQSNDSNGRLAQW